MARRIRSAAVCAAGGMTIPAGEVHPKPGKTYANSYGTLPSERT